MPRSTRCSGKSRLDSGCQALWPWQAARGCQARVAKESVSPRLSRWIVECGQNGELCLPVVVDVLAQVVTKGGAASDMFGNMQSPVIHTEEQS